jgi:hypothetical protein
MQRAPVTVEEQLLQKAIKEECPWENLPKRIQATLSSKEEWHRRLVSHHVVLFCNLFFIALSAFCNE